MPDQATAVKTTLGRVATVTVRCTHQAKRIEGDIARLLRLESGWHTFDLVASPRWHTAAAPEHQQEHQTDPNGSWTNANFHTRTQ